MEKIRVLIGMLGLDQHELGAIVVSKLLRDAGMEVTTGLLEAEATADLSPYVWKPES